MNRNTIDKLFFSFSNDIDALLVSSADNVGYATGFWGSFARLLITKSGTVILISNALYSRVAQKLCTNIGIEYREITRSKYFFTELFSELDINTLGFESADVTVDRWKGMKKSFGTVDLVPLPKTLEVLREIKTEDEIAKLKHAASIGDACLQVVIDSLYEGITEKETAWIFEKTAKEKYGVEKLSFTPIVSFGENTASPHSFPSNKKLEQNMPILIDCGVFYEHYASDLTRCFWFGDGTTDGYAEWKNIYDLVHQSQLGGIRQMIPGNAVKKSDEAARKILGKQAKYFEYSFGHGVGVHVHEMPAVSCRNTSDVFRENMVVTAEPGVHFPGKFGIRIEDLMHITKNGAEYLSSFPKDTFLLNNQ